MDPESGTDAVRDVGITDGRIVRIAPGELRGRRVLDAKGLVVAPGFIDLHQHGQDAENDRAKVQDGVTTALELEIGPPDVAAFLRARAGRALINYGTSASHPWARVHAWGGELPPAGRRAMCCRRRGRPRTRTPLPSASAPMQERLRERASAGGLGVGLGINYTPGASRLEIIETFRVAAERGVPLWPHIRAAGYGSSIESVAEVIAAAAVTGAPLHIVHINSMGLGQVFECLKLIEGARAHGLDVTSRPIRTAGARPCSAPPSSIRAGASACTSTTPTFAWCRRGRR